MKKIFLITSLIIFVLSSKPIFSQSSDYLIVTTITDTLDGYHQCVKTLKNHRNAQVITFSAGNVEGLFSSLFSIAPRYVAIVLKPKELDINLIRRFLMMSTELDNDPFSDFSYGYITGATDQDALNFVNNIIYAENHNIANYPFKIGGYSASSLNFVYTFVNDYMTFLNPSSYSNIYMETNDNGSGINFFHSNTNYMQNNKLLDIGHNGDPHMLWLFDGGNSNPNPPVWNYDSTKIENIAYSRVGLTSYDISNLNLYPAVAFNGACHSGETKRVMVEGDIAATFGNTQGLVKFYTMSDTFSFALSILKTGITGYFAPCGANNANDQGEEVYNALLYNEPLGDIHKRGIDGVVMGFLGNIPKLRIFTEGESTYQSDVLPSGTFDPNDWSGAYSMLGGKANRIYFGDPFFNPYQNNHSDSLKITKSIIDSINQGTIDIHLIYKKPDASDIYFPAWDKFHFGNTRIYDVIELPSYFGNLTNLQVIDSSAPYSIVIHAIEHNLGKTFLHLEVDIPNDMYSEINYNITFRISYTTAGLNEVKEYTDYLFLYPNPAKDQLTLQYYNPYNENNTLIIYNATGEEIRKIENISMNSCKIDIANLRTGLYYIRLQNHSGISGKGKFIKL